MDLPTLQLTTTICSALATGLNFLLLPVILFRSGKDIGTYKYLLLLYTTTSLVSSGVILIELPILLPSSYGILFLGTNPRFPKVVSQIAMLAHGACYAFWTVILTLSFVYRMLSIRERQNLLFKKLHIFVILIFICGLIALFSNVCIWAPTPADNLNQHVTALTGYSLTELSYCGGEFFNDPRKVVGSGFWLSLVFTVCVIPCSIIIAYCAIRTYSWFKCTVNVNTSRRLLHIRIFYLLILQTTIPVIFAFAPVVIATVLAILSKDISDSVNLTYSALLPIAQTISLLLLYQMRMHTNVVFTCDLLFIIACQLYARFVRYSIKMNDYPWKRRQQRPHIPAKAVLDFGFRLSRKVYYQSLKGQPIALTTSATPPPTIKTFALSVVPSRHFKKAVSPINGNHLQHSPQFYEFIATVSNHFSNICLYFAGSNSELFNRLEQWSVRSEAPSVFLGNRLVTNLNVKLIFWIHMILTLMSPISNFIPLTFDSYRYSAKNTTDTCDFLVSDEVSFSLRVPGVVIVFLKSASLMALSFERIVATKWAKHYDALKGVCFGTVLLSATGVYYVAIAVLVLSWQLKFSGFHLITSAVIHTMRFHIMMGLTIISDTIALIIFIILYYVNHDRIEKVKTPGYSTRKWLSFRYQTRENYTMIYMLLPVLIIHWLIVVVSFVPQIVTEYISLFESSANKVLFVEYANQEFQYAFIVSVYFIARRIWNLRVSGTVNASKTIAEVHFSQLDEIWSNNQSKNDARRQPKPASTECISIDEVRIEPAVITVSAEVHNVGSRASVTSVEVSSPDNQETTILGAETPEIEEINDSCEQAPEPAPRRIIQVGRDDCEQAPEPTARRIIQVVPRKAAVATDNKAPTGEVENKASAMKSVC